MSSSRAIYKTIDKMKELMSLINLGSDILWVLADDWEYLMTHPPYPIKLMSPRVWTFRVFEVECEGHEVPSQDFLPSRTIEPPSKLYYPLGYKMQVELATESNGALGFGVKKSNLPSSPDMIKLVINLPSSLDDDFPNYLCSPGHYFLDGLYNTHLPWGAA